MFCKDSRTENMLTHRGVPWKYRTGIKFGDLLRTWNVHNYGRSRARVEEAICEYGARMEAGSSAPAGVGRKTERGIELLDGVQRLSAAELNGETLFPLYLVECDDTTAKVIRTLANSLLQGSHQEPTDWYRRQAIQLLVIDCGMSLEEVARSGGWNLGIVKSDHEAMLWGFAMRRIGVPESFTDLTKKGAKGRVLAFAEHARMKDLEIAPKPIVEFCVDLKRAGFSNGDAQPYIKAFFGDLNRRDAKRLHQAFAKNLERFRKDPEVVTRIEGRKRSSLDPGIKLRKQLKSTLTVTEELLSSNTSLLYVDEFLHIWHQVEKNIKALGKTKSKP